MELRYVPKDKREEIVRRTALSAEADAHRDEFDIERISAIAERGIAGFNEATIAATRARAQASRAEANQLARKVELKDDEARKTWADDVLRWRRGWMAGDAELGLNSWIASLEEEWVRASAYSPEQMIALPGGGQIKAGTYVTIIEVGHGLGMSALAQLPTPAPAPEAVEAAQATLEAAEAANGHGKVTKLKKATARG